MNRNSKQPSAKRPRDWKAISRTAYEEGGQNIGRMMLWHPEKEAQLWKWLGGTNIWPRWYLAAFRSHWIKDHPEDYYRWKDARARARRKARRKQAELLQVEEFIDAEFTVIAHFPNGVVE